jgi:hypothetical protein
LLAYSVHQPPAYVDLTLNLLAAVYEPAPFLRGPWEFAGAVSFAHIPLSQHPRALSSIVLRI